MRKIILLYIILGKCSFAQTSISVRILTQLKVNSFLFSTDKGNYSVWAEGEKIFDLDESGILKIKIVEDLIELQAVENNLGKFVNVKIIGSGNDNAFRIKSIDPDKNYRFYQDNLSLIFDSENKLLKMINVVEMGKYVAGVVDAETGKGNCIEFYKAQAILARTYALSIIDKHFAEGFQICDQVHCQVFHGRTKVEGILKAVFETGGIVAVDDNLNLINAVFHSNSGGETINSEDLWGKPTTYLKAVNDTFSLNMPNSKWRRKMATDDWLSYLKIKHNYPIEDSSAIILALNFKQVKRKIFLEYKNIKIPLKNIRNDLAMRSTFFNIEKIGDSLLFTGKGYGHGIGMCQEGAMKMTKQGYKYDEVINFYYRNVQLIDECQLPFFREE